MSGAQAATYQGGWMRRTHALKSKIQNLAFFENRLALEALSACYGLGAKAFHSFYLQIFKSVSKRQNIFSID